MIIHLKLSYIVTHVTIERCKVAYQLDFEKTQKYVPTYLNKNVGHIPCLNRQIGKKVGDLKNHHVNIFFKYFFLLKLNFFEFILN
jgi:hypothetical protein